MRELFSTYGSRRDVEPMAGLVARLEALRTEVRVCTPPDLAELPAGVGVPLAPIGQPVRPPVTKASPQSADRARRAAELVAARFDPVAAAGEGEAPVATGVMPTGGWR